jgi:Ion channel
MSRTKSDNAVVRQRFLIFFGRKLRIISPIIFALTLVQLALGFFAGFIEHWSLGDSIYFTFITGLTIGYGDFVPKHFLSRLAAVAIALDGIVVMGLIAAVAVRALEETAKAQGE